VSGRDARALILHLLDATRADEAVRLAEDADEQLWREVARLGGTAEFDYHLLTHKMASAKARRQAIVEAADERRAMLAGVDERG
jgi:hypothetical protein